MLFSIQVAAYTDGRNCVTQYDCILLRHIFWNQPDESERIYEWLLGRIVFDDNIAQVQFLISGIFGRACKHIKDPDRKGELLAQVEQIKSLLLTKMAAVLQCVEGELHPFLSDCIYLDCRIYSHMAWYCNSVFLINIGYSSILLCGHGHLSVIHCSLQEVFRNLQIIFGCLWMRVNLR